jgi:hypothetical protein
MTPEIRRAAIRAAAKAALITAIGCSGDAKPSSSTTPSNVAAAPAKPESKVDCGTFLDGSGNIGTYAKEFFPPDFRDWRIYAKEMVVTVHIALWGTVLAIQDGQQLQLAMADFAD